MKGLVGGVLRWFEGRGLAGGLPAGRTGRRLECLERLRLSPRHTLHLIRLGESELLVASWPDGCGLIWSLPRRETVAGREAAR